MKDFRPIIALPGGFPQGSALDVSRGDGGKSSWGRLLIAARPTKLRVPHRIAGRRARQCFIDAQLAKTLAGKPPAPPEYPSRRCPTGANLRALGSQSKFIHPSPNRAATIRRDACLWAHRRQANSFRPFRQRGEGFRQGFPVVGVPLATALGRQCDCRSVFRAKPIYRRWRSTGGATSSIVASRGEDTGEPKPSPVAKSLPPTAILGRALFACGRPGCTCLRCGRLGCRCLRCGRLGCRCLWCGHPGFTCRRDACTTTNSPTSRAAESRAHRDRPVNASGVRSPALKIPSRLCSVKSVRGGPGRKAPRFGVAECFLAVAPSRRRDVQENHAACRGTHCFGRAAVELDLVRRPRLRFGESALAGADERRECLILVPLVRLV